MARRTTDRTRIQDVALTLFATRGYAATSLQEIADALGVTTAALYYHFATKAALLHSLADPVLDAERALLAGYADGPLEAAARRTLVGAHIDLALAHRQVVAWLRHDLSALAQPGIGAHVDANADQLQRLLVGPEPSVVAQLQAASAVGALARLLAVLDERELWEARDTLVGATLAALRGA